VGTSFLAELLHEGDLKQIRKQQFKRVSNPLNCGFLAMPGPPVFVGRVGVLGVGVPPKAGSDIGGLMSDRVETQVRSAGTLKNPIVTLRIKSVIV
jgi:hypothetical protein